MATKPSDGITIRTHRAGDLGWIVQRHGEQYAADYGYDERFEGVVAELAAKFLAGHDAARERCWIAERDGERLGCVLLVQISPELGKLRTLLVEPKARGLGLGRRLVDECLKFARGAGYKKVTLWTHRNLTAARKLYEQAGFRMVKSEKVHTFGKELVDEFWEIEL